MVFPVCLIIKVKTYNIAVFLGKDRVEVLDACGYLATHMNENIRDFLEAHSCGKKLFVSPRFVPREAARLSFAPAFIYLYLRLSIEESLCAFLELFTADFNRNQKIIAKLLQLIKKRENDHD